MPQIEDIRQTLFDLAPSYTTEDSVQIARIDRFIRRAQNRVNQELWGDTYEEGVAYLAWHNLLSAGIDSSGGAREGGLLEEKVDNAHFKYSDAAGQGDGPHRSTWPGQQFDAMASSIIVEPFLA